MVQFRLVRAAVEYSEVPAVSYVTGQPQDCSVTTTHLWYYINLHWMGWLGHSLRAGQPWHTWPPATQ